MRSVRFTLGSLILLASLNTLPAFAVDFEARRSEYVPPLYESTCAEVYEREADPGTRIYSIFLEHRGSIRMIFRPTPECPVIEASNPGHDDQAITRVVPTTCELVRIESQREASCPNVTSGSFSKKYQRQRWEGARFAMEPVRTSVYSAKPLPEHRHVRITLNDPFTEVFLSFENPNCDPAAPFRANRSQDHEQSVFVFQPPPQAGYCGEVSVTSRRLPTD